MAGGTGSDALQTTVQQATDAAYQAADRTCLPQTVYRNANSAGWWHTNALAGLLARAEVSLTALPQRYFQ